MYILLMLNENKDHVIDAEWSHWSDFPDPRKKDLVSAPLGPGCYELRRRDNGQLVLYGVGGHVAQRLTSLLPTPYGCGTRNNNGKREYVFLHLENIEYRTLACLTYEEAKVSEKKLRVNKDKYLFST